MRLKYLVLISFILGFLGANAQEEIRFNHLTTDNGLSNNLVETILQDSAGYIWFGTLDGLCRYDGNSFTTYVHKNHDSNSVSDNQIICLCEDKQYLIWVGTGYGLSCFNTITNKFTNYYFDKISAKNADNYITSITVDAQGVIWVSTSNDLYKFDRLSGKFTNVKYAFDDFTKIRIHDIGSTKYGRLFVALTRGVLYSDDEGQSFKPAETINREIRKKRVSSFYIDKYQRIWLGIWDSPVVYEINSQTFDVKQHIFDTTKYDSINLNNAARAMQLLNDSILLIGAIVSGQPHGGCLYALNINSGESIKYMHTQNAYSLSSNHVMSLFIDKQKTVWAGTGSGINYFNFNLLNFHELQPLPGEDSSMFSGGALLTNDARGNLWVATDNNKFVCYAPSAAKASTLKLISETAIQNISNSIYYMYSSGDSILLATDNGLAVFNMVNKTFKYLLDLPDSMLVLKQPNIRQIIKDKNNSFWFATFNHGIYEYIPSEKKVNKYFYKGDPNTANIPMQSTLLPECIAEDKHGNIWVGMSNYGFCSIHPDAGTIDWNKKIDKAADIKSLGEIDDVFCDTSDIVYFATVRSGLAELDTRKNTFRVYTVEDGLSNDDIAKITPGDQNHLWLSTKKGLSCFDKATKKFQNYYKGNGLLNDVFVFTDGVFNSGKIFVNCATCVEYFNPSTILKSTLQIFPEFTSMQVNNKEYESDLSQKIYLGYRENIISFTFSAFDFIDNSQDKFAYKLEGLDNDWNYCGNRRYAEYTNLPGGDYTLKLKVQTTDGNWVETAHPIFLHIATPYWKTWWFIILCGIAAFSLGYLFYYLKMQRKLEAERLRTRLARDLHDDIGSSLSSISILSDMAVRNTSNSPEETQIIFNRISESSHKTMESMKDIVWTVNPENDAVDSLLARMRIYCSEILEPKAIEYDFIAGAEVENSKLTMEQRRNFYLIFKEAINNIAKYSECNRVTIAINKSEDKIKMKITDNGIGFNFTDVANKGNGLKNMAERAKLIGGDIVIESIEKEGATIVLQFPLT